MSERSTAALGRPQLKGIWPYGKPGSVFQQPLVKFINLYQPCYPPTGKEFVDLAHLGVSVQLEERIFRYPSPHTLMEGLHELSLSTAEGNSNPPSVISRADNWTRPSTPAKNTRRTLSQESKFGSDFDPAEQTKHKEGIPKAISSYLLKHIKCCLLNNEREALFKEHPHQVLRYVLYRKLINAYQNFWERTSPRKARQT